MNWEGFLESIQRGKVIPIVGNDLCLMKDAAGNVIQLDFYIAQELIKRLGVGVAGDTLYDLALYNGRANIYQTIDDILDELQQEKKGKKFFSNPLEELVKITDFNFFISTTFDNRLEKIVKHFRKNEKNAVINYCSGSSTLLPENADNIVFNLLGSIGGDTQYALTEDEILEHFYSLAYNRNSHSLPQFLYEKIRGKTLLLIGCSYPDWFMRFIIRALANESFQRKRYIDYIADNRTHNDAKLAKFLRFFKSEIIVLEDAPTTGAVRVENAIAFVEKLYEEWIKLNASRVPVKYEGDVFISYNNQDLDKAKEIRNQIRAEGIQVWFDEESLSSGQHRPHIESEIKKCKVFIPVVSNHILEKPESYSQLVEWKAAQKRFEADQYYGQQSFAILPTFIDDTPRTDARLSDFMRSFAHFHISQLDHIIQQIKSELTPLDN
jgi:predicted CopG family antitoxin